MTSNYKFSVTHSKLKGALLFPHQCPHLVVHGQGGGGVGGGLAPVAPEAGEVSPVTPQHAWLPHLGIESLLAWPRLALVTLGHKVLVLDKLVLLVQCVLPRVCHPEGVITGARGHLHMEYVTSVTSRIFTNLEVAVVIDPVVQRHGLVAETLLGAPHPSVDNDEDEQEDEDKQHAANEGDEPSLGGELLHVHVGARAHVDGGHQSVGVHGEHQGRGEWAVTLASEGGSPDDIDLVEAQVTCTLGRH